jgi:hypothetical protein
MIQTDILRHVVVASARNPNGWVVHRVMEWSFLQFGIQSPSVIAWYYVVVCAVHYKDWAFDLFHFGVISKDIERVQSVGRTYANKTSNATF